MTPTINRYIKNCLSIPYTDTTMHIDIDIKKLNIKMKHEAREILIKSIEDRINNLKV